MSQFGSSNFHSLSGDVITFPRVVGGIRRTIRRTGPNEVFNDSVRRNHRAVGSAEDNLRVLGHFPDELRAKCRRRCSVLFERLDLSKGANLGKAWCPICAEFNTGQTHRLPTTRKAARRAALQIPALPKHLQKCQAE